MDLPPGFRFHPTDEELITHYLYKKVLDSNFSAAAIGDVDLNKVEPWELPWKAKIGEKKCYFFCVRDKKYPNGLRTNRATAAGYWKATGKDKEIFGGKFLVGMKKTLVFYKGRAPKGEKSNWVMHEYRLEGKFSLQNLPKTATNEWVICRVFQKSSDGKKIPISGLAALNSTDDDESSPLPPLMDSSPYGYNSMPAIAATADVSCFSNLADIRNINQKEVKDYIDNPLSASSSFNPMNPIPLNPLPNLFLMAHSAPIQANMQHPNSFLVQDQSFLMALMESYGQSMKQSLKTDKEITSISQDTALSNDEISSVVSNLEAPSTSIGQMDPDYLWYY